MPKVKEYMTTPVITITKDETIGKAVEMMNQHDTNGLIVVDKATDKVIGVISSLDILSYLVPDYLEEDKHLASFEPSQLFVRRIHEIKNDKVETCMTSKSLRTINPEDSLMEASALLTEFRIHRLPVVDKENKLVGYLSRSDIKRAFEKITNIAESK